MISRYARKELQQLWSDKAKYTRWLQVEVLALRAYAKLNTNISQLDIDKIAQAPINLEKIVAIEQEVGHDVIAFIKSFSQTLGPEKKWLHYGLTSTDIVDTAQAYCLKQVNELLLVKIKSLHANLGQLALKHKYTYQMGRTHGMHAEVTTFGYKVANWYAELGRNLERFEMARQHVEVAKISGAVGNYVHIPLSIQDFVANSLGLGSASITTQTLSRDRHSFYLNVIALIGTFLEKMATEIRHLQRTEVGEVQEPFTIHQHGSSAMPHKKNPIISENICGLARVLRGYVVTAYENIALWHERDISHSSAERIILVDATTLIDFMLHRFNAMLSKLIINEKTMLANIQMSSGMAFSQRAMLLLINKKKYSRMQAYKLVQDLAKKASQTKKDFKKMLLASGAFQETDVKDLYDLKHYRQSIDAVFKRLGLDSKN